MSEKEKLLQMIQEHPSIIRYKKIEEIINNHRELKGKFNELKAVQKQLVNAKEIGKTQAIEAFQAKFDELYLTIESYPLMSEYLALQSDINEMVQSIVKIIEEGIEKDFE